MNSRPLFAETVPRWRALYWDSEAVENMDWNILWVPAPSIAIFTTPSWWYCKLFPSSQMFPINMKSVPAAFLNTMSEENPPVLHMVKSLRSDVAFRPPTSKTMVFWKRIFE